MKQCRRCDKRFPIDNFHRNGQNKDGRASYCKPCAIVKVRASPSYQKGVSTQASPGTGQSYWAKNRHRLVSTTEGKTTVSKNEKHVTRIKQQGCSRCGYNRNFSALHFHHINPEDKVDRISALMNQPSTQAIDDELAKCELLCANCHAEEAYPHRDTLAYWLTGLKP